MKTQMTPIISLILPTYNVGRYIESCIDSCEIQDLERDRYEIIIVDDGCTDGITPSIINRLSLKYNNIRLITQTNQGLSVARNNGFKEARGKYVWFIDPDDIITRNCLKTLVSIMEKTDIDALVVGPSIPFKDEFPRAFDIATDVSEQFTGVDFVLRSKKLDIAAWCYIFKRDFWSQFRFYPGICYEDHQIIGYALSKAKKVMSLTQFSCYNYIQREGSIMNSAANKFKVMSSAAVINTHLQYANEATTIALRDYFNKSASSQFIYGIKSIISIKNNKVLLDEFLNTVAIRPTRLYASGAIKRLW